MPPVFAVYRCVQMDACSFVVLVLFFISFFCLNFRVTILLLLFKFTELKLEFFISCCCWLHVEKLSMFQQIMYTASYWIYMYSLRDQFGDNFFLYFNVRDKSLWHDDSRKRTNLFKIECEISEQPINLIKRYFKISLQPYTINRNSFCNRFWNLDWKKWQFMNLTIEQIAHKKISKWSNVDQSVVKVLPATFNNSFAVLFFIFLLYSWNIMNLLLLVTREC